MMRTIMAAALMVSMPAFALGQTQNKHTALSQADQELVVLSRKAVSDCIGKEIVVLDDATANVPSGVMRNAAVKGQFDAVELTDAQTHINGDLAVVTGRVVFKGGPPEWRTKETSSGVTIRFSRREGKWTFVGLCIGKCAAE